MKVKPLNELKGNTLEVGYSEQDVDQVNGRFSFNNTVKRTTPSSVKGTVSFICPILTDPYLIESTRQNLEGKDTTDNEADSEIFALNTEPLTSLFNTIFFETTGGSNFLRFAETDTALFPIRRPFQITSGAPYNGTYTPVSVTVVGTDLLVEVAETVVPGNAYAVFVYAVRKLLRVAYDSVTGIPEQDTIFNIEDLTPARLTETQRRLIDSIFSDPALLGKKITFDSGDKNTDLTTTRNGVTITERADYVIGSNILFKSWLIEVQIRMNEDAVDILEANPNQCVSFDWLGDRYEGFIYKAEASANDSREQALTLIASPLTDLTNLITDNG